MKSIAEIEITPTNIVLNGKRRIDLFGYFEDVGEDYSYYINERGIGSLLIPREKLVGLDALQTLTAELEISTKDYNHQTLPVEIAFSDCDLSVVAPDLQAQAGERGRKVVGGRRDEVVALAQKIVEHFHQLAGQEFPVLQLIAV